MARRHPYRSIVEARKAQSRPRVPIPPALATRLRRFVRFAGSSVICTALDQLVAGLLFLALRRPLADNGFLRILVGTVVARCISQTLNYVLNHRLVFAGDDQGEGHRRPSRRESLPRFLVVATGILTLSTVGVYLLHTYTGIAESVAKLLMDSALFFLNYYLQQAWVFTTEPSINPRRARKGRSPRQGSR